LAEEYRAPKKKIYIFVVFSSSLLSLCVGSIDDIVPNGWPQTKKAVKIIVEAVEDLKKTVKEFDETSRELSGKMIDAIERFEKFSSNLARKMLWLTLVIALLTIVMILIMIFK